MGLEAGTYINDLVTTNPVGASDPKSQGDDHLRLLKAVLKATFPSADRVFDLAMVGTLTAITGNTAPAASTFTYLGGDSNVSAAAIITLPAASTVSAGKRRRFYSSTTASVTLAPNGTDTIGGTNAAFRLPAHEQVELMSNGSNGWIVTVRPSHFVGQIVVCGLSAIPSGHALLACDGAAISRTTYGGLFAALSTTFGIGDGSTTFNVPDLRGRVPVGTGTGQFASTFTVDTATDIITVDSNESLYTGGIVQVSTTGGLPAPLAAATNYYWIRLSATTGKLATSLANAHAGTAIDLTTTGTGVHTATLSLASRTIGAKGGEESHSLITAELPAHTHTVNDPGHTHAGYNNVGGFQITGASESTGTTPTGSSVTGITLNNTGSTAVHNIMQPFVSTPFYIKT